MSRIQVLVEKSCKKHPCLNNGKTLPRQGFVALNGERLFALGTLALQDPDIGLHTLVQTRPRWEHLQGTYKGYLTFPAGQIETIAKDERLTKLSEIVGIGCGIAALNSQFSMNINRFERFTPVSKGRRVDFECRARGRRYFHETKGTTYWSRIDTLRKDILEQKDETKKFCKEKGKGPRVTACTGSIAVYRHAKRTTFDTTILLLDPPPGEDQGGRAVEESDELATVLRYYQNFYAVTHSSVANPGRSGLGEWLATVVRALINGESAPRSAPRGLVARAPLGQTGSGGVRYRGTWFDARITRPVVRQFTSFEEASRTIQDPVTFIGVSEVVTSLIQECRWEGLLDFVDRSGADSRVNGRTTILDSGIMARPVHLNDDEEQNSKKTFVLLRKLLEKLGECN